MLLSLCLALVGCATYNVSEVDQSEEVIENQRSNGMSHKQKKRNSFYMH